LRIADFGLRIHHTASIHNSIIGPIHSSIYAGCALDPVAAAPCNLSALSTGAGLVLECFSDEMKCGLRIGVWGPIRNPQSSI